MTKLHGYTVHQTMLKPFYYQLMHTTLKNTELLKHSKITLQHVSVYVETIFRELQSVLGQKLHIPLHSARHTRLTGHNMQP